MYDLLKRVAERMRALEGISEMREAYRGESVPDLVWMAIVLARRRGLKFTGESAVGEAMAILFARECWTGLMARDSKDRSST